MWTRGSAIALVFVTGMVATGFAQEPQFRFPDRSTYSRAKIYLLDNTRYETHDLAIERDRLSFTAGGDGNLREVELKDVLAIKVGAGTRAPEYALYGGLVFAATALGGVAGYQGEEDLNEGAVIGLLTLIGVGFGAVIGSFQKKWRDLYVTDRAATADVSSSVSLAVHGSARDAFVGVRLAF